MADEIFEEICNKIASCRPRTATITSSGGKTTKVMRQYEARGCGTPSNVCYIRYEWDDSKWIKHQVTRHIMHDSCSESINAFLPESRTFLQKNRLVAGLPMAGAYYECMMHYDYYYTPIKSSVSGCCDECLRRHEKEKERLVLYTLILRRALHDDIVPAIMQIMVQI